MIDIVTQGIGETRVSALKSAAERHPDKKQDTLARKPF
jgi:hypothetical protein